MNEAPLAAEPAYPPRGVPPAEAGSVLGLIMLSSAFIGQGLFAVIVDWFAGKGMLDAPIRLELVPAFLAIPLAWFAFSAQSDAAFYVLLLAFAFAIAPFNTINNTVVQQIAPPALRSRLAALFIFSISIVGFAIGPALVGWLSEYVYGEERLGDAMRIVATLAMACGFILPLLARKPLLACMRDKGAA